MSTLFGKSVASTYKDLLQVSNNNIGVDDVVRYIEDGEGTRSALALSTDTVVLSGHLLPQVNSQVDLGSAELKFRHLFLSDNTIYIGDETFNTTDIKVVKDIQTTATVPVSSVIELAQGAAQAGDIDASFFTDEFSTEYAQVKSLAGNSVQPGTNPTFESINVTGAITGPDVMVLDPAAIGDNTGRVVIAGDLQVDGVTTTVNSTTISTSGKTIELSNGATDAASSDGAGVYVSGSQATFKYSAAGDSWTSNKNLEVQGTSKLNGDTTVTGAIDVTGDAQLTNLAVAGNTTMNNQLQVGASFRVNPNGAIGGVAPNTIGQTIVWNGSEWVTGVSSGGEEAREVPDGFVYSLASGQTTYTINFQQVYTTPPSLSTNLQITGGGEIIPYVITDVTTTYLTVVFADTIPDDNYKLHITFGGRDVYWTQGALNELSYTSGDVNVTNGLHVGGNLTVQGETTTINASELSIEDRDIVLANNTSSQHLSGLNGQAGITWGDDDKVKLRYESTQGFSLLAGDLNAGDLNGNVGIGTTNPTRTLHIVDATSDGSGGIKVQNYKPVIELSDSTTNATATTLTQDNTNFVIANNNVDALAIKSNGNVGIGATNPGSLLHISGGDSDARDITLQYEGTSAFTEQGIIWKDFRGQTNAQITNILHGDAVDEPAANLDFRVGDGTSSLRHAMTIKANGFVGIGTTDPQQALHIQQLGTTSGNYGHVQAIVENTLSSLGRHGAGLRLISNDSGMGAEMYMSADANGNNFEGLGIRTYEDYPIVFCTNTEAGRIADGQTTVGTPEAAAGVVHGEAMRITSSGNVGIGEVDPSGTLHVSSGRTAGDLLKVELAPTAEGNPAGVHITNTNANFTEESAYLKITDQAGSHKLRVNKSGKVGINTGTPGSILHVNGDGDSDNYYSIFKLGNPAWNQAGGCGFSFHRRESDKWAGMQINTELDDGMAIMIRNTSKAPNPSFGLNGDGLITHCAGINIGSATGASANTLDDYETGFFTPVLNTVENNVVVSYPASQIQGQYTKIGNMVHVLLRINKTNVHSDSAQESGRLIVTGLPFARSNNVSVQAAGSWWLDNGDSGTDQIGVSYVNYVARIYLVRSTTIASERYVRGNEMGIDRVLYVNATYYTT